MAGEEGFQAGGAFAQNIQSRYAYEGFAADKQGAVYGWLCITLTFFVLDQPLFGHSSGHDDTMICVAQQKIQFAVKNIEVAAARLDQNCRKFVAILEKERFLFVVQFQQ
jgi:hypothetical protein